MSDTWGSVYQMERDRATGNDPESLRREIERLRTLLHDVETDLRRETVGGWDTSATTLERIADTIHSAINR